MSLSHAVRLVALIYLLCHVGYSTYYSRVYTTNSTCEYSLNKPIGNGVVRLYRNGATSSSYYYGIVQIYINDQWGNICDDYWYDQYEADVICHQLGYTGASNYIRAGLRRLIIMIYYVS